MTDQNNAHINQTTFFNIDVYNNNSTGGDISSIYQTSLQSPLLIHPNEHEICCCRARIPLDQIPLSQDNIPFQQWAIEIGVPIVGAPNTYNYYQSYVPQFNQIITTTANFNIGINDQYIQTTSLPQNEPTTTQTLALTPKVPQLPFQVAFLPGGNVGNGITNIVFGLSYTAIATSRFNISRYNTATGLFIDTINVRTSINRPNVVILGICMPSNSNKVYVCSYDPDGGGSHLLSDIFNFPVGVDIGIPSPAIAVTAISCSSTQLTMSYLAGNAPSIQNFTLTPSAIAQLSIFALGATRASIITSDEGYYVGEYIGPECAVFTQRDIMTDAVISTFTYPTSPIIYVLDRFLGTDIYGNILVGVSLFETNQYAILAYDTGSTDLSYIITMSGTNRPLVISNMIMTTSTFNNTAPYAVMTIQDYLDQINLAFSSIVAQIPLPLSSPQLVPTLVFNSSTSIISIVTDHSCETSLLTSCVINFNKLLWSFFKFRSINAISTNLGVGSQTLFISNSISTASSITPQPNSTLYRFADLTRILIGTSRISVKGDNQSSNELLVNFSDFVVDTSNGIPNLIIYQPTILRWYQLYQTSPLNNLDIFVSYANRAGQVFPINISPYNSIGIKLQFRNSNSLANQYSDSRT